MSVGPTGIPSSIAGAPLSQTRGSDLDRTQSETAHQARQTQANQRAERAAGVGHTEQDHGASDRDADGRRPWEIGAPPPSDTPDDEVDEAGHGPESRKGRDATGERGTRLDLSG